MAVVKKISELTAKGSNIGANDLVIVGVSNGTDYDLKSVTGNQLVGAAVAQTITSGVTTTAPSQDAVKTALDLKVDKVTGSRLITSAESTLIGNTSGTNSGDETVTTIKTKLGITTLSGSNTGDETITTIKSKLGVTTLSGSNTGDQDLTPYATKSAPTFTGLTTLDTVKVTTGNYITPVDVVGIDVLGNVNRVSASNGRTALGLGTLATQSGTFSGTSSGTNTGDQIISDATISLTDITTNNFDTTKHGFVPKGTNTGKFLKDDGTWGTPASGGASGIWGIANSSGVYTYYATWALAVAAATSGQCIELFADITENTNIYTLKNGVNINGNGHTIAGTTTATFNDGGVAVICDVSNLIISKSLGGALSMTSTSSNITGNCKIISTDASYDCCIVYGQLTGWSINGSVVYPIALYSTGILNYININTTGSFGIVSYSTTCKINNCIIKTSGSGISSNASNGGIVNNCTVNTNGLAISIVTGEINNSSATSNTASAIALGANSSANNSYGRSASGVACSGVASSTFNNCEIVTDANVTGTSTPSYYNCKLWSKADWVLNGGGGGKIVNCTIISNYNGPVIREATTGTYIVDCYFEVTNSGATPIFSSGTPTLYISGNSVKGTTNFKSAGIVNGQTNIIDTQGNIILN